VSHLSYSDALEDTLQLRDVLIDAHPDPYTSFGGAIDFHRAFHQIIKFLPQDGLETEEFWNRLQKLVAGIKDSHTVLTLPNKRKQDNRKFPLTFQVVEQSLVVNGYYDPKYSWCVGSKLVALDGLSQSEFLEQINWSAENEYVKLAQLARRIDTVIREQGILTLLTPEEKKVDVKAELASYKLEQLFLPKSSLSLPQPNNRLDFFTAIRENRLEEFCHKDSKISDFAWSYVEEVPYFRIDGPFHYREAFEFYQKEMPNWLYGYGLNSDSARDVIESLSSFKDILDEVVQAVKEKKRLIVDLRYAHGGNSIILPLFIYTLFGYESLLRMNDYAIVKYSLLYNNTHKTKMNLGYDFTSEDLWLNVRKNISPDPQTARLAEAQLSKWLSAMPSLANMGLEKDWNGIKGLKICTLTSAETFSAGFDFALALFRAGADLVGVAPSQTMNCFIDSLSFKLKHSGIEGQVSSKLDVSFPEKYPTRNLKMTPKIEISYGDLRRNNFDPNTSVKIGLHALQKIH
jgi:hypothetical protein